MLCVEYVKHASTYSTQSIIVSGVLHRYYKSFDVSTSIFFVQVVAAAGVPMAVLPAVDVAAAVAAAVAAGYETRSRAEDSTKQVSTVKRALY
jgi:hypothetical protein